MSFGVFFSIIASLIFFVFFPVKILQFFAAAHLFVIFFSYAYSKILYYGLSAKHLYKVIRLFKNQTAEIILSIENTSCLNAFNIYIKDYSSDFFYRDCQEFLVQLSMGQEKKIFYNLEGNKRGEYFIGPISISAGDPLGLFPWEKKVESICRIIIYPSLYKIDHDAKKGITQGDIVINNKMHEDLNQYRSFREYFPGDDIRRINWKVSARMGSLHVMEYISSINSPVLILLNLNFDDYPAKMQSFFIERAIDAAASIIMLFFNLKQKVGLFSNGIVDNNNLYIPLMNDICHVMNILENLAKIKTFDQGNFKKPDVVQMMFDQNILIQPNTRIIIISPNLKMEHIKLINLNIKKGLLFEFLQVGDYNKININEAVKNKIKYYKLQNSGINFM